ncbi:MAG: threonine synthase [Muribaculum sp.]|nr:threonine synthase [Muribaculaceae bacterium]MCM1080688.1 threonine synthase [Muribaculum sp.]
MNYYSTNNKAYRASLAEAVISPVAPDGGLFMPERLPVIPNAFFRHTGQMSLPDIAFVVASTLFNDDIESEKLKEIVAETLNFNIPLKEVRPNIYAVELYNGPTFASKDVGARFLARLLANLCQKKDSDRIVNVLVATSGNSGPAVANGFFDMPGMRVFVLYPQGKLSKIQEMQFTTLGKNVTAIEVDGSYDDCQEMVKAAFNDPVLNSAMTLTSANSINIARLLPQMFYFYHAYARLMQKHIPTDKIFVAVPCGNLGNICSALIAKKMGLAINHFFATSNKGNAFLDYLKSGNISPDLNAQMAVNAMGFGYPSNFARILDLYNYSHNQISNDISGFSYSDNDITQIIADTYKETGYILDPQGATAYKALVENISEGSVGIFLETTHPAKFKQKVESAINSTIEIPQKLSQCMQREKKTVKMSPQYPALRKFLLG